MKDGFLKVGKLNINALDHENTTALHWAILLKVSITCFIYFTTNESESSFADE